MKKIYSLLISLSATFTSIAQIPIPAAPHQAIAATVPLIPTLMFVRPASNTVVGTHKNGVYHRGNTPQSPWRECRMALS